MNLKLTDIFRNVFGVDEITPQTSIDDIDDWDSLGHVTLVAALEKKFSIRFDFSEVVELTSVGRIIEHLNRKGLSE